MRVVNSAPRRSRVSKKASGLPIPHTAQMRPSVSRERGRRSPFATRHSMDGTCRVRRTGTPGQYRSIASNTGSSDSAWSQRVRRMCVARPMADSGSRNTPRGSSRPFPNGLVASMTSTFSSRSSRTYWYPSSRISVSQSYSSMAFRAPATRSAHRTIKASGAFVAIRAGSSPSLAHSSGVPLPAWTAMAPPVCAPYPRVRTATRCPSRVSRRARSITAGVLPVPPAVMLPMLMTRASTRTRGWRRRNRIPRRITGVARVNSPARGRGRGSPRRTRSATL